MQAALERYRNRRRRLDVQGSYGGGYEGDGSAGLEGGAGLGGAGSGGVGVGGAYEGGAAGGGGLGIDGGGEQSSPGISFMIILKLYVGTN